MKRREEEKNYKEEIKVEGKKVENKRKSFYTLLLEQSIYNKK